MAQKIIPILAYHKVDPRFEWGITHVTPRQFEKQIQYLSEAGYRSISLEQCLLPNRPIHAEKMIVITFDDAYESVYQYAFPILNQFQYSATVFAITNFVGKLNSWDVNLGGIRFRHLNWRQLRELADAGWELGSHSANHPDLINCSDSELWTELDSSKKKIEDNTGVKVIFLSYPFGRYNRRVIHFVKEVEYRGACSLNYYHSDLNTEPYRIGRMGVYWWDSTHSFKRKLESNYFTHFEALKQKAVTFCSLGTVILKNFKKNPCNF